MFLFLFINLITCPQRKRTRRDLKRSFSPLHWVTPVQLTCSSDRQIWTLCMPFTNLFQGFSPLLKKTFGECLTWQFRRTVFCSLWDLSPRLEISFASNWRSACV